MRDKFKDATVIFMVVHYQFDCVRLTLINILSIIESLEDTYLVLINSAGSKEITNYIHRIKSDKVDLVELPINFGYNHAVNYYIRDFINDQNLPKIMISLGSDILFSKEDFVTLTKAISDLDKYATLSLSYENNLHNPEMNVLKPKNVQGTQNSWHIRHTFFCPVAGGIMGFRGEILKNHLGYTLFHPKYYPKKYIRLMPYGGADASLYKAVRGKYRVGYIADTKALHLKSKEGDMDIPKTWEAFIKHLDQIESRFINPQ